MINEGHEGEKEVKTADRMKNGGNKRGEEGKRVSDRIGK